MHLSGQPEYTLDQNYFWHDPAHDTIPDATPMLLCDIFDLVCSFGVPVIPVEEGHLYAHADMHRKIYFLAKILETKSIALTICRIDEVNHERPQDRLLFLKRQGKDSGIICWSELVSVQDVRASIRDTDSRMFDQGFIVKTSLTRMPLTTPNIRGKLKVAEIFPWPERKFWLRPTDTSFREMISRFDQPKDVEHVHSGSSSFLCRTRDVKKIALRQTIRRKCFEDVLKRNGINTEEYQKLSTKKILMIENELIKLMQTELKRVHLEPNPLL